MSCKDCPDPVDPAAPQDDFYRLFTVVYTGGPQGAFFASVGRALTEDKTDTVTKWTRPKVHPQGELEYSQKEPEPPAIEGYERDVNNPWLLRPLLPFCAWLLLHVRRVDTGAVTITTSCNLPNREIGPNESLTAARCQNCPRRCQ